MARPTKPKDLKPKAEPDAGGGPTPVPGGGGGGGLDLKFVVTLVAIVLSSILGSVGSVYFLAPMVLEPVISQAISKGAEKGGEHGDAHGDPAAAHASKVGLNLELDEFMVNLKTDPEAGGNQYLRAKMSLNIGVPPEEDCYAVAAGGEHHAQLPAKMTINGESGVIAGAAAPIDRTMLASGGGAPVDPTVACLATFKGNMSKYVPTMRDVINAALMKRTAGNLATLEGIESLKDEIKDEINQLLDSKYKIVRVNFEDFIIQR